MFYQFVINTHKKYVIIFCAIKKFCIHFIFNWTGIINGVDLQYEYLHI